MRKPNVRNTDPETSYQAGIESLGRISMRSTMHRHLCTWGPKTASEMRDVLRKFPQWAEVETNSVARRMTDLSQMGLVRDTGDRRPGPTGRKQIVWSAHGSRWSQ